MDKREREHVIDQLPEELQAEAWSIAEKASPPKSLEALVKKKIGDECAYMCKTWLLRSESSLEEAREVFLSLGRDRLVPWGRAFGAEKE